MKALNKNENGVMLVCPKKKIQWDVSRCSILNRKAMFQVRGTIQVSSKGIHINLWKWLSRSFYPKDKDKFHESPSILRIKSCLAFTTIWCKKCFFLGT